MFRDRFTTVALGLLLLSFLGFWACSPNRNHNASYNGGDQHFNSAQVQGEAQKINLDAVHQAFYQTQGSDFNQWMQNFEQRVNQIYQGTDVVQIDANKNNGMIRVSGYIERDGVAGYQPSGDETLFQLQQTGPANGAQGFPYALTGAGGSPYYQGYPPPMYYHRSLLDNPFVQYFVLSRLLTPSWHYYTPPARVTVIHHYVTNYRQSPAYHSQQQQNKGFFSGLFKKPGASGFARSSKGFGTGPGSSFGSGDKGRSWFGGKNSGSSWSGRRSGSSDGSSAGSSWGQQRSWGGFSGGSHWGGQRSFGGFSGRSFGRHR